MHAIFLPKGQWMAYFAMVSFSKRNTPKALDSIGFEENYGRIWSHGFIICCTRGRKSVSVETEEVVALTEEETTMESKYGTCSVCLAPIESTYHGVTTKLSAKYCSSTYTKWNMFKNFNIRSYCNWIFCFGIPSTDGSGRTLTMEYFVDRWSQILPKKQCHHT